MIWRIVTAVTFMLFCATNSVAQEWVRTGLELHVLPSPPPQPIDEQRVRAQILDGCNSGLVRFADTSAMRNSLTVSGWSDEFRSLASIAAMSDQFDEADAILQQLSDDTEATPLQRVVLQNQRVLNALQFRRLDHAEKLLEEFGFSTELPAPVLADRLFWSVLAQPKSEDAARWRREYSERLDEAMEADPSSYQVRVWRVLAWLRAKHWQSSSNCSALIRDFSDRILDATQSLACPLFLGHMSHAIERELQSRPGVSPRSDQEVWHLFLNGLSATLSQDNSVRQRSLEALRRAPRSLRCVSEMDTSLLQLRVGK